MAAELPSASELLCAMHGQHVCGALCHLAHELADVHRRMRAGLRPDLAHHRATLIVSIDDWAASHLPAPACGARVHTETLGQTIDHIASAAARAFHILMTDDPAGTLMHAEWTHLAELEIAYSDLARDIESGRRCLPPATTRDGAQVMRRARTSGNAARQARASTEYSDKPVCR
ncbi:hypothetical protein BJY24_006536 [Nocardia transvalensis]|uniref:DUF4254 domain-containing protein n=1 Tax=Nocardia transvalensis TaxID=37333 RepID=A0A7W9PL47_9NOCA|nr:DUF4254 domain-containing protein [Nocardia transvalensis]MBB5917624.1 hypothetical protein [Nocardia transvalensis]